MNIYDLIRRVAVMQEAEYIVNTRSTIRQCASHFRVSKTKIHKDMQSCLSRINPELYNQVNVIFCQNFKERQSRGGIAKKKKYGNRRS